MRERAYELFGNCPEMYHAQLGLIEFIDLLRNEREFLKELCGEDSN